MIRAILPGTMDANRPMNPQATYTTADIARELGVSKMTVRNWTTRYAEFLSPAASPQPGAQRAFTQRDRIVLSFVAGMVSEGHRHEFIAQRATETTFDPNEITPADELATDQPHDAADEHHAPIVAGDVPTYLAALATRQDDHIQRQDDRIRQLEDSVRRIDNHTRLIVAAVAGVVAGAVIVGILAALVMLR